MNSLSSWVVSVKPPLVYCCTPGKAMSISRGAFYSHWNESGVALVHYDLVESNIYPNGYEAGCSMFWVLFGMG